MSAFSYKRDAAAYATMPLNGVDAYNVIDIMCFRRRDDHVEREARGPGRDEDAVKEPPELQLQSQDAPEDTQLYQAGHRHVQVLGQKLTRRLREQHSAIR